MLTERKRSDRILMFGEAEASNAGGNSNRNNRIVEAGASP
jgi:hypothetical protein